MQEDRHHRYTGPGAGKMADALLESLQGLRLAARPFRENHQDLATAERLIGELKRIAAFLAAAPLHRNDADDVGGEPDAEAPGQKIVHRRHRPERAGNSWVISHDSPHPLEPRE